jgi:glutamate-1-semialdehyde 2,1-aminomutase
VKVVAIIQARMGSTRLPNKVMKLIGGKPMIEILLSRLSKSTEIDKIIVATSVDPLNKPLIDHVEKLGYQCFVGSESDVLDRYFQAAKASDADIVVRVTGDCPVIDPSLVDECIRKFKSCDVDYFSNVAPATYPDGLDTEVFTFDALRQSAQLAKNSYEREHVTPYLLDPENFRQGRKINDKDLSHLRWTVDEVADFEVMTKIFDHYDRYD